MFFNCHDGNSALLLSVGDQTLETLCVNANALMLASHMDLSQLLHKPCLYQVPTTVV